MMSIIITITTIINILTDCNYSNSKILNDFMELITKHHNRIKLTILISDQNKREGSSTSTKIRGSYLQDHTCLSTSIPPAYWVRDEDQVSTALFDNCVKMQGGREEEVERLREKDLEKKLERKKKEKELKMESKRARELEKQRAREKGGEADRITDKDTGEGNKAIYEI